MSCVESQIFLAVLRIHDIFVWILDPDPAIFVIDLQDASKKLIFYTIFLLITIWRNIYIIFQR